MKTLLDRRLIGSVSSLALSLIVPAVAHAQAASADAKADNGGNDIIVTAQRRSERLEEVPISITTIQGDSLKERGIESYTKIGQIAVGTMISRNGGSINPAIRGVTNSLVGPGQENNVALYVDGFAQIGLFSTDADLVNIESVSVLKGPQGTLYGRNATGGAILITTANPSLTRTQAKFEGSYRRYNDKRVSAYISTPLSDTVAVNISAALRDSDNYFYDIIRKTNAIPIKNRSVRGKLLWEPSDNAKFILGGGYSYINNGTGNAYGYFAHIAAVYDAPAAGPIATGRYDRSTTFPEKGVFQVSTVNLTSEIDFGWAKLTSYTQYQKDFDDIHFDTDGSPAEFSDTYVSFDQKLLSEEIALTSPSGRKLEWTVGGLAMKIDGSEPVNSYIAATGKFFPIVGTLDSRALAAYVEGTYHITDALSLTAGVRYSYEKRAHKFTSAGTLVTDTSKGSSRVTPRAVLKYQLAPRTNVYASFSQGFKSATYNVSTASTTPVEPETITAYEVGFKTASSTFRFDAAAFYYDYTNLQVSSSLVLPDGRLTGILSNAAASKIYGAEAMFSYAVTPRLNVNGGLGYLHARYKNFPTATASAVLDVNPKWASIGGRNVSGQIQDWSEQRMLRAPDWTATFSFDYTQPLSRGSLMFTGNMSWQSEFAPTSAALFQTINTATTPPTRSAQGAQRYVQPAYALVNAQVTWRAPGEKFRLTGFVENLFNQKYAVQINGNASGDYMIPGQPVTYGVRVNLDF